MRIRRRDGTMVEVDDGYILRDGEGFVAEAMFMDAGLIHDARGRPAGTRPGYLLGDNAAADQARVAAYDAYDQAISERWRLGPGQPKPSAPQTVTPPPTFASPQAAQAARDAAYEQYRRDIEQRWQRR
jgi:hypothetical protein